MNNGGKVSVVFEIRTKWNFRNIGINFAASMAMCGLFIFLSYSLYASDLEKVLGVIVTALWTSTIIMWILPTHSFR